MTYADISRSICKWCAKDVGLGPDGSHLDDDGSANWRLGRNCTAPTRNEVIERLSADLTAAQQKLTKAMDLLDRASSRFEDAAPPDATWYKELFLLTGDHMILTEEGWAGGESKASQLEECGEESILDEVNAPA